MNSHLKKALSEMDNPYYLGFRRSAREIIDAILVDNEIDFEKILKERTLSFHNNDSAFSLIMRLLVELEFLSYYKGGAFEVVETNAEEPIGFYLEKTLYFTKEENAQTYANAYEKVHKRTTVEIFKSTTVQR